jgi:hypothetical protein
MVRIHSLLRDDLPRKAEIKKAMGGRETTHGLIFNLESYRGTGQTPVSLFTHHHQFLTVNRQISSIKIISPNSL